MDSQIEHILSQCDRDQRKVARFTRSRNQHCFVIAGAGSGKTHTLKQRVAYLLECGENPIHITALSFSNLSGKELKERIEKAHDLGHLVNANTYHGVGFWWLRSWDISDARVFDGYKMKSTISSILWNKANPYPYPIEPGRVVSLFNELRQEGLLPQEIEARLAAQPIEGRFGTHGDHLVQVWRQYTDIKRAERVVDLMDMIWLWWLEMTTKPSRLNDVLNHIDYLLVDECQDLSELQFRIVEMIATSAQVMMVGDPKQSIYGFRGADLDRLALCIQSLRATKLALTTNYRSTKRVVAAGNLIASEAPEASWCKQSSAHRLQSGHVELWRPASASAESKCVLDDIVMRLNDDVSPSDIAIIYRNNSQAGPIEPALMSENIPYRVYGAKSLYQRAEIQDAMAYIQLAADMSNLKALSRLCNKPTRYIGKALKARWEEHHIKGESVVLALEAAIAETTRSNDRERLSHLLRDVLTLEQIGELGPFAVLEWLYALKGAKGKTFIQKYAGEPEEDNDRTENLHVLLAVSRQLSTCAELVDIAKKRKSPRGPAVHLMTVHKSKGLEFKYVYLIGVNADVYRNGDDEQRRVLYVGATRARDELIISAPEDTKASFYLRPLTDQMMPADEAA